MKFYATCGPVPNEHMSILSVPVCVKKTVQNFKPNGTLSVVQLT